MRLIITSACLTAIALAAPQPQEVKFLDDSAVKEPVAGLDDWGFFSHPMTSMGDFFSKMFMDIQSFFGGQSFFPETEMKQVEEKNVTLEDGTKFTSSLHEITNELGEVVGQVHRTTMNLMGFGSPPKSSENEDPSSRGFFGGLLDTLYEVFEDPNGPDFEDEYYGGDEDDYMEASADFENVEVEYADGDYEYEDGEEIDDIKEDEEEDDYEDGEEIDNIEEDEDENDDEDDEDDDEDEDYEEDDEEDDSEEEALGDYTDNSRTVQKPIFDVRSLFSKKPSEYKRPSFGKKEW